MTTTLVRPRITVSPVQLSSPDRGARQDARIRSAALALLWLSLLVVAYWWIADGGVRDLTGWVSGLTSVGRISALWSSDLLLIQVLLMARLPFVENAFGRDQLTRLHRIVGFLSFDLMLVHIVTIVAGYAAGRWSAVPATSWDLLTNYGGMLLALAGTVCLVMVVVTSIRAARRRLRYESWHLIHLYAYLGVGLALPHQLWTGQQFLSSVPRTVFWWSLWLAAAGTVSIWRFGLPLWRSLRHQIRVTSVVREADDVVSVYLTGTCLDRLPVRSGQFLIVRFMSGRGWTRANPFSLSAAPDGRSLRITAKALGEGSARLAHLQPGTRVMFEGPYGRLSDRARTRRRVLLAGAGVGITPLRSLAEGLPYAPGEATVLYRFTDQPLFEREFAALSAERGLRTVPLPGPRRHPSSVLGAYRSQAEELLALHHLVPHLAEHDVYLCGPERWTATFTELAAAAGIPRAHIHTESFGW